MRTRILIPLLAVLGFAGAIVTVVRGESTSPVPVAVRHEPKIPFASYVAGAGIVEARTGNIAIGTPVSGIVKAIDVARGERVAAGTSLFRLDDRDLQGQLLPAVARVKEAAANLAKARNLLKVGEGMNVGRSISAVDMENRRYDAAIAEAKLASAKAEVARLRTEIDRRTVRAPVAGRVLQINIRPGEYAVSGAVDPPLMLFGDVSRLHLRVNVDESDAWRVRAGAPAVAYLRGHPEVKTPLRFVRFEPVVVPKTALTGRNSERTDTRVLQVIYSFDPAKLPIYVGQQMDVFIKASPDGGAKS